MEISTNKDLTNKDLIDDEDIYVSAPTHQRVLKWLRERHDIVIDIFTSLTFSTKSGIAFGYDIWHKKSSEEWRMIQSLDTFLTYEAAENDAINEVLNNYL
jgi:hypothetical protein